jgi:hypothetical protein
MVRHWTTLVSHGRFAHPCLRGFCPRGFARQVRSAPTRYDLICSRLYALNTAIRLTQTLRQLRRSAMSTSACRYCGVLKNKRTRLTKCLILCLCSWNTAQRSTTHYTGTTADRNSACSISYDQTLLQRPLSY